MPEVFRIARWTMRVVRGNIAFTALFAAAAQSLPDLGILANSSRLLRQR